MLRTAGFIMYIFATCSQAITVQSNCYAHFAVIKGQCEAWEVSFFRLHFKAAAIRTCSLCRTKKMNLRLQLIKRRVFLAWKPNWLAYHHVFKLWLTSLTPGRALDQLCHRIQTSKKIFNLPKNSSKKLKPNTFVPRTVNILKVPRVNPELKDDLLDKVKIVMSSFSKGFNQRYCPSSQSCRQTCGSQEK